MAYPVPPVLSVGPSVVAAGGESISLEERRAKALRLRLAGISADEIGRRLAADPTYNASGTTLQGGYGWARFRDGKPVSLAKIGAQVTKDLEAQATRNRESLDRDIETMREIHLQRLETLLTFCWPKASAGSQLHIGRATEVLDQIASMHGWKKADTVVTHAGGITVSAESQQPVIDTEYATKFLDAVREADLMGEEQLALVASAIDPANVVEAVVVEPETA